MMKENSFMDDLFRGKAARYSPWYLTITGLMAVSAILGIFLFLNGAAPAGAQGSDLLSTIITKSVSPASAKAGEQFTFKVDITNPELVTTTAAVKFVDIFPIAVNIISVSSSFGGDVLLTPINVINADPVERRVEMSLVPFLPQEKRTITIVAQVNQNAPGGNYTNTAILDFSGLIKPSNSISYQIVTTTPTPGVTQVIVDKTVSPTATGIGGLFTFDIRMTNNGLFPATNLLFEDRLPTVLNIISVTSSDNEDTLLRTIPEINADPTGRLVQMRLVSIPPGARRRITIVAQVNASAIFTANYGNFAILTDGTSIWRSSTIAYQIITDLVLPPTGGRELPRAAQNRFLPLMMMGLFFGGLGGFGMFSSARVKKGGSAVTAGRIAIGSLFLIVVGLLLTLTACGLNAPAPPPESSAPQSGLPAAVQPAQSQAEVQDVAASGPAEIQPAVVPEEEQEFIEPTPPVSAGSADKRLDLSPVKRIVVPSLGIDAKVQFIPFDGRTWRVDLLETYVAWLGDSAWPGLGGNIALAGHVSLNDGSDGPFRNLDQLKPGDIVEVYTTQNKYTFRVREYATVGSGDIAVVANTAATQLTLITCSNWDELKQTYQNRLVVNSDLVSVQPTGSQTSSN